MQGNCQSSSNQQHWSNNIRLPAKHHFQIEIFSGLILLDRSITQPPPVNILKNPPWNSSETLSAKPVLCLVKVPWDCSNPVYWVCKEDWSESRQPSRDEDIQLQKSISHSLHQTGKLCSYSPNRTLASVQLLYEISKFWDFFCYLASLRAVFWDWQPYVPGKGLWSPR